MKRVLRHNLGPSPIHNGLIFWTFFITLAGLAALLALPILLERRLDTYRVEIEDYIEPARHQISRALQFAYDARNYAISAYFLLDEAPFAPYSSRRECYEAKLADWHEI